MYFVSIFFNIYLFNGNIIFFWIIFSGKDCFFVCEWVCIIFKVTGDVF